MPKTNRRRTTHRKRTSQRKRKNVKRGGAPLKVRYEYNKYVTITDEEKNIKNMKTFLGINNYYPTEQDVENAYIEQFVNEDHFSNEYITVSGNLKTPYNSHKTGNTGDNPINITIRRIIPLDRTTGYGM